MDHPEKTNPTMQPLQTQPQETSQKPAQGESRSQGAKRGSKTRIDVFVGNLSWQTGPGELRRAFDELGAGEVVDARVVRESETNRSRGFGFVTFHSAGEAETAVSAMAGRLIDGRAVTVKRCE